MKSSKHWKMVSLMLLVAGIFFPAAAEKTPYNVLIIHTDEHNFRTLGCYREVLPEKQAKMWGETVVETPHIDSIAERGFVSDACYAASPICSPSRASFVSGLYPMDTDVIENDIPIRSEIETFATALGNAGYKTGYAGKWHLAGMKEHIEQVMGEKSGKPPRNIYLAPQFFDGWVPAGQGMGFADNRFMWDTGHWKKVVSKPQGKPAVFHPRDVGDETTFPTDWLANRTIEFVEAHQDEPFCYMVSIPDPHGSDAVREPYYSMYKDVDFKTPYTASLDRDSAPSWGLPEKKMKGFDDAAYFGMVKCIDDNVGRILSKLGELGLSEHTLVLFTSDHGDLRGEHARQNKGTPHEASAKIPFVIAAPGLIPAGTRSSMVLNTVDFKPTLLSLLDVEAAQPSQGRDCSAILRGEPVSKDWKNLTFSRSPGVRAGVGWLMATDGRFKLIASLNPPEPIWLIDLKNDPEERVNQAANPEFKPVVKSMSAALLDYAIKHSDPNLEVGGVRKKLEDSSR